ncbi:hypothetical protein CCR75_002442 [Bremia lactucae]|uniref:Uncharacterized protein n=1 Tax=Bremia lactucae TaxID=4779 RepID=A0A976FIP7_BRELC|nr:hypothetical protein CCR75_002442 [Bremia lactucae]
MLGKLSGVDYKGIGTGFRQWALLFLDAVEMAELGCEYKWADHIKANKLQRNLHGRALQDYQVHIKR